LKNTRTAARDPLKHSGIIKPQTGFNVVFLRTAFIGDNSSLGLNFRQGDPDELYTTFDGISMLLNPKALQPLVCSFSHVT
jgi:hypothetical protein